MTEGGVWCGSIHGNADADADKAFESRLKEGHLFIAGRRPEKWEGFQVHDPHMMEVRSCRDARELGRLEQALGMVGGSA